MEERREHEPHPGFGDATVTDRVEHGRRDVHILARSRDSTEVTSAAPSPSEIRVAQAELVGWLDGLVNGIVIAVRVEMAEAEARAQAIEESEPADLLHPGQYL